MGRSSLSAHPPKAVDVWPAEVEAPKNVVDYGQLEKQNDCVYFVGPLHGVAISKYENGQKEGEATFKDGEMISEKEWDEDGNLTREYPKTEAPAQAGSGQDS